MRPASSHAIRTVELQQSAVIEFEFEQDGKFYGGKYSPSRVAAPSISLGRKPVDNVAMRPERHRRGINHLRAQP